MQIKDRNADDRAGQQGDTIYRQWSGYFTIHARCGRHTSKAFLYTLRQVRKLSQVVPALQHILTLDLSSSRISMTASLTPFCSVCRQFLGFIPSSVHVLQISFDDVHPVFPWPYRSSCSPSVPSAWPDEVFWSPPKKKTEVAGTLIKIRVQATSVFFFNNEL